MECSRSKELYLYQYVNVITSALDMGKTCRLDIIGESMSPTLVEGDSVILERAEKIRRGDIVLYRVSETEFVLHRVVSMRHGIIARGDNNIANERIDAHSIIARVCTIEKNGHTISRKSMRYSTYYSRSVVRRFFRRVRKRLAR